ncbi:hypothetical protein BJ912DRAFT_38620 [Pholiota molesta]|nr:hypothetical protein BJ912DRAFT_38620 [Pholiota molesta]
MHALLLVPPPTDNKLPRIYHASIHDFLKDRSRSLSYYIDEGQGYAYLRQRWLKIIENRAQSRIRTFFAVKAFIYNCNKSHSSTNDALVDDLAHFDLRATLEGFSNFEVDLYFPDWGGFMECILERLASSRDDVFPRLQSDFYSFFLNRIARYPQSLQPYIPILLMGHPQGQDIFDILLHGASRSAEEFKQLNDLDKSLLDIRSFDHAEWLPIKALLEDTAKAGKFSINGGRYAALAKAIVKVICAKPGERNHRIKFEKLDDLGVRYKLDGSDPTMRIALKDPELNWFREILEKSWIDLDLVKLLHEHTVQFKNSVSSTSGHKRIAEISRRYIEQCEPFSR